MISKLAFRTRLGAVYLFTALLCVASAAQATDWTYDDVDRIVAISDIHGAYDAMVRTLQSAAVIDENIAWIGGTTHLVIVGDILDRGSDSRPAMDLLIRLEDEARAAGGKVHVLIGNHEAMNLIGDLRYVAKDEYAAFAEDESVAERDAWFAEYTAKRSSSDASVEEQRNEFDEQFPLGFFAHRTAFSQDGRYGNWLLSKPILVVINGTAFVHGGLSPEVADHGLQGVNGTLHQEMVTYVSEVDTLINAGLLLPTDSFYDHPELLNAFATSLITDESTANAVTAVTQLNDLELITLEGPLWYRGNVYCSDLIEIDRLDSTLAAIGASRVVIGHSPTRGHRVLERFDGRVIEVDTGMLNSYYNGEGNALVISGNTLSVVNESGEVFAGPLPHPRYVGRRMAGLDTATIETLLAEGQVIAEREDEAGRKIYRIGDGSRHFDAEFIQRSGRNFYPEVAAYRLDRLLGLDMVPVAVRRELDGKDGSLRFLPARTIDEARRHAEARGGSAYCPLPLQWDAMMVFDALIYNEGRIAPSIQYDESSWQLILVGHTNAFGTSKSRPAHLQKVELKTGLAWRDVLTSLNETLLEGRLGDVLDKRRRKALLSRRDQLLKPNK